MSAIQKSKVDISVYGIQNKRKFYKYCNLDSIVIELIIIFDCIQNIRRYLLDHVMKNSPCIT